MKTRDGQELLMNFKEWLTWAERQSQRTLKCIRHDNAKEFTEGVFAAAIKKMGIEQQTIVPYEHEQNGTAENSNLILLDKARSEIVESGMDKAYWPYAIATTVKVANRSPVNHMNITPWENSRVRDPTFGISEFSVRCAGPEYPRKR